MSCFAHSLQLVVNKYNEVGSFARLLTSMHALVKKVNKSSKATEKLILLCGKKVIGNCPTWWSSTFLMIERLLAIKGPLSAVLEEQGWDNLATSEWKTIGYIRDLLKPFAQYTSLVSGEDYTTISCVIPIIMELNLHLEEMKKIPEVSGAANMLLVELKYRFTDPGDAEHDPIFLASAMVDPRFRVLLNPTQQDSAKSELLKYLIKVPERPF